MNNPIEDHHHSDALSGKAAAALALSAVAVSYGAAIIVHAWGGNQLKIETILAVVFAVPFGAGLKYAPNTNAVVKSCMVFGAIVAAMVTIYTGMTGQQYLAQQNKIEVVGLESNPLQIAGFQIMAFKRSLPKTKNIKWDAKHNRRIYRVKMPRECCGGVRWCPEAD